MKQERIESLFRKAFLFHRAEGGTGEFESHHLIMSFFKDGETHFTDRLSSVLGQDYISRYRKLLINNSDTFVDSSNWQVLWREKVDNVDETDMEAFEKLCRIKTLRGVRLFFILAGIGNEPSENQIDILFRLLNSSFESLSLGDELSFVIDISERAFLGNIDPLIGREKELEQMMTILLRKNKNNPVIIGEAGVGKTALVEGFALRIFEKEVPVPFLDKRILALNLGEMMAGSQFRGEFEKRLKLLIDMLKKRKDLILFVDELHTIVGAGSTDGSNMDLGNLIKPALARGELQCIGATTMEEFRKIEKDKALERRFQPICLNEPDSEETLNILCRISGKYESFHSVKYTKDAIKSAVYLSSQYVQDRHQPDKAIDLIDEAGGKKRLYPVNENDIPLITENDIVNLLKERTGIQILSAEDRKKKISCLDIELQKKIKGQNNACREVSDVIQAVRDPGKPRGIFLFMGPTGVGKTYFVKVFSEVLLGLNEDSIIRFNMEEFREPHSVARLFGSPPGYVGYDEGGRLTDLVRRKGSCVILLDEVEKAHPSVLQSFLGIFDEGMCRDSTNREVSFRNSYIFMTSNIRVSKQIRKEAKGVGFDLPSNKKEINEEDLIKEALIQKGLSREFINRIDKLVGFSSLDNDSYREIGKLIFEEYGSLIETNRRKYKFLDSALEVLLAEKKNVEYGARELKRIASKILGKPIGDAIRDSMPEDLLIISGIDKKIDIQILKGDIKSE